MHKRISGFIPLVALIIIAAAVLFGIGASVYVATQQPQPAEQQSVQTSQGQQQVISPNVDTSNWQTYRNDKYGFEFKYPTNWKLSEVVEIPNGIGFGFFNTGVLFSISSLTQDEWETRMNKAEVRVLGQNDKQVFIVGHPVPYSIPKDKKVLFEQILSTFKFTEPSSLKNGVTGMSQYTDSNFGFSFWYPNTWTVQNTATKNNYAGGTVQKTLTIAPPAEPNGYNGDVITIDEFNSPTREITIPYDLCSPMSGSSVPAHRYYFDHAWMEEIPAYTGYSEKDGSRYSIPASTKAADVSSNTMGGLHMLNAGCSGAVIPLSAHNFVVFLFNSRDVGPNYINIAKTITATDPSVATPVSVDEQRQTITTAGVLLGAIGTKVGYWYITSDHVYNWRGDVVASANPSTFRLISAYSDGYTDGTAGTPYATDGVRVYSGWSPEAAALSGADPATFVAIRQQYQIPYAVNSGKYGESFTDYDTTFAKDKSHVWYEGKLISGADPNTFVVTGSTYAQDGNGNYILAHDANHIYGLDKKNNIVVEDMPSPSSAGTLRGTVGGAFYSCSTQGNDPKNFGITIYQGDMLIRKLSFNSDGTFGINLPAGTYTIHQDYYQPNLSCSGSCWQGNFPQTVTVRSGETSVVSITAIPISCNAL